MKKFLLSLLAILCIGGMVNAAEQSYAIILKNASNNNGQTLPGVSDIESGDSYVKSISGELCYTGQYGWRLGQNKKPQGKLTITLSDQGIVNATKIVVEASANKNAAKQILAVNETSTTLGSTNTNDTYAKCEAPVNSNLTEISLETKRTSTGSSSEGFIYIHAITVFYNDAPASIGWSAENATVYLGDENNKFPTFNNPDNLFIIYDSSDKNVATIDDEGNITLVGAGTTTITALDENNIEYTYTLVVERRLDTIFDNNLINNQGDFTIEDIKLGDGLENAWTTNSYGMTANGYVSGKAHEADSWLISPVIDLRYASETTLSFEHGVQYFTDIETAKTETSFNIREENGDWETVTIPYPEALGNNAVSTGAISLAQYEGKKIQLGFHYTSGATKSGRWQIKNVLIQGYIDEPTLPEGGLDFTVENIENDSFVIGKDVESAKITVSGVHAESELYCKFTAAPAENPESAPRKAVDHTGYEKIERDADNNHTITVDGAGTLELYTYHPATDSKSDIRTINVTKEDGTTAIDSIASDVADGEAEYFNLQGVRINPENAAPGLYIRRQGGKAAKVMVK